YPIPSYLPIAHSLIDTVYAHPDKNGSAHYVVFGDIPPKPTVFGSVPIIAHHPIIILFKCIGVGNFTVYQDLIAIYFQGIAFIFLYYFLINGQNFQIEGYGLASCGAIDSLHIVHRARMIGILGKYGCVLVFIGNLLNGYDAVLPRKILGFLLR